MKQFRLVNNITGWGVFLFALFVYASTMEPTVSFWDCGEYISAAVNLEVVHPSGSPFHAMLGRIFSLFTDRANDAASINFLSALSSALTVLFFFWSLTMLGLKLYKKQGMDLDKPNLVALMGAGVVGAAAITFLDSFWFSAVEGEVYALSALFSSAILWSMLKWDREADDARSSRWLVLIALLIGMGCGVHLLHLLAIPAVVYVYYFRKNQKITRRGVLLAFGAGALLVGIVMFGLLDWWMRIAGVFERPFVNDMGFPFWSGFAFFSLLFFGTVIWLMIRAKRRQQPVLQVAMMTVIAAFIGLSSYAMVVIRSDAGPGINMNKPSDLYTLHAYLKREQYGHRPLFFGPQFTANPLPLPRGKEEKKRWKRGIAEDGTEKYIVAGSKPEYNFKVSRSELQGVPEPTIQRLKEENKRVFFPRMGHFQNPEHAEAYKEWLDVPQNQRANYVPTYLDNLKYFFKYQMGYMYWRYFMWNFSGKQDDIQGHIQRGLSNGNWMTGFDFIDKNRVTGYNSYESRISKSRNKFFMIPFILGLVGLFFHFSKEKRGAWVIMTFFVFMGIVNLLNSNEPPFEPRERDYAVALSFCAFAMWIGFGVLAIYNQIRKRQPGMLGAAGAIVIGMIAPFLMGSGGWDDHDRSNKYMARATAIAYLESCDSNAVLFTQGDNDTYPLWYLQEVEHIRNDVRVVNLSLLAVDWYIDQLRDAKNRSTPVRLTMREEDIRGDRRTQVAITDNPDYISKYGTDARAALDFVRRGPTTNTGYGPLQYLPSKRLTIPVDTNKVKINGALSPGQTPVAQLSIELNKSRIIKDELIILDIVANHDWDRPIYFAITVPENKRLGLSRYLQQEGMAYKLVPAEVPRINTDVMYEKVMNRWNWGNVDKAKSMYLEETAMRTAKMLRSTMSQVLAGTLVREGDRLASSARTDSTRAAELTAQAETKYSRALEVAERALTAFPERNVPITEFNEMYPFVEIFYEHGDPAKAAPRAEEMVTLMNDELYYWFSTDQVRRLRIEAGGKKDFVRYHLIQGQSGGAALPFAIRSIGEIFQLYNQVLSLMETNGDKERAAQLSTAYEQLLASLDVEDPYRSLLPAAPPAGQ